MPKKVDHIARRREIAEAAARTIAETGIERMRLVDVARAANATTGTVTHYFDDKDAVLAAVLDHIAQGLRQAVASDEEIDIVELAFVALPTSSQASEQWRAWLSFIGRMLVDERLAAINKRYYDSFIEDLTALAARAQARGRLRADIAPDLIANALLTIVDGLGMRLSLEPHAWPPARVHHQLDAMLQPYLRDPATPA